MNPITSFSVLALPLTGVAISFWVNPYVALTFFGAAAITAMSLQMANAWQKFALLRMGKSRSVKGAIQGRRSCE